MKCDTRDCCWRQESPVPVDRGDVKGGFVEVALPDIVTGWNSPVVAATVGGLRPLQVVDQF